MEKRLNKFTVKYTEAGDKHQKTVLTDSEENAKEEVFEFVNMFNVKNVSVELVKEPSNFKEGVGNPKYYK